VNSRERVLDTISHKPTDRVPLDIGGTNNTSMHRTVEKRLMDALGLDYPESNVTSVDQQVVSPAESLLRHFGSDSRCLYVRETVPWVEEDGIYYDHWHIGRRDDGQYYTMVSHPLAGADPRSALEAYEWPDPTSPVRVEGLAEQAASYGGEYALVLEGLREVCFGLPSWIRGTAEFYMDMATDPVFTNEFLDRSLDWNIKSLRFVMEQIGDSLDIVKFADDLGSQDSLLISPAMYREFIKPRQKQIVDIAKEYGCRVLLHSCGAIRPLIDDFIEIGIDALNPVQLSAAGMVPQELKAEFGDRITFWGGGIDTQHALPHSTPSQVREEVRRNLEAFKSGGGYVFAQVHNIQSDVPVENIIAMYEAYREFAVL